MNTGSREARWFWITLLLSSISIVAVVFAAWELVESRFFRGVDYLTLHYLYISRGIMSSLLLAAWAAWYVLRVRRRSEDELRRSWEHYRNLLEASPGAVALFDSDLRVTEWNATAERLYGYSKQQVLGRSLPTVPADRVEELRQQMERVRTGQPVADVETRRADRGETSFEVQLSLLPFRDSAGEDLFLEVTSDIRERVRLRERLLEIEKLTSMGKMAAGTAHHLNTPLAAMLLRVQMMRERARHAPVQPDLERLEGGILYCQQFVRRLLEFGRRPAARKEPQPIAGCLSSVVAFLAPALDSRGVRVSLDVGAVDGDQVLADRNLLEALLLILLSNALDAVADGSSIDVRCLRAGGERIEIRIADEGCGIAPSQLPHVFEPFYTTKGPGKGTGLGLAIARNIVLEHGGSIRLESAPGRGTVASVELPVWVPEAGKAAP
ncbi:MAG: PAS domain-containing sensor histidine kinase [Thermoanaerobaculia bacterium]